MSAGTSGKPARDFRARYGPWALVAGASAGLGAEFATQLAERGLNLVLVARRAELLQMLAAQLEATHGIQVRCVPLDLADAHAAETLAAATADLDLGLLIYNAGFSPIGGFYDIDLESHLRELDVNCRAPLALAYTIGRRLLARGRGGIVLMSSLSSGQGSAYISNYAATKAYNLVLAEGLWEELRGQGVDVLACRPGAVANEGYIASRGGRSDGATPPRAVVAVTLRALGKGPSVIPGAGYRLAAFIMGHLLPRRTAVQIMGRVLRGMYARPAPEA